MRILWLSNSSRSPTGYGNQTNVFTPRIKKAGHTIALNSFYGIEGSPLINQHGITEYPRFVDPYGNDSVGYLYSYHKAEALISLIDPFVLNPRVVADLNWIAWVPVDSEPILPETVTTLRKAKRVWAMSRFGERLLKQAGFTNVDYVPHGIEGSIFKPLNRDERLADLKTNTGIDLAGKFVVTMNSANKGTPSRKGFFEAFAAFKVFADEHPDAVLYCHSESAGVWHGEDLVRVCDMVGLTPEQVIFPPYFHHVLGMLPPSYLNDIYNVSDVLLNTSHGGGFEIPLVEAQMAGCPVIATDFSAMPELVFAGWKVPGTPFMHASGATQRIPMISWIVESLKAAYQKRGDAQFRAQARAGALAYEADKVFKQYMKPAIKRIQDDVKTAAAIRAAQANLKAGITPKPIPTNGIKPEAMLLGAGK